MLLKYGLCSCHVFGDIGNIYPSLSTMIEPAMTSSANIIYFSGEIPQGDPEGDQSTLFRKLRLLSKERNHVGLASLLECVTRAIKDEWNRLDRHHRDAMPFFENILDLTDHVVALRKTSLGAAVERVLVLVYQLGSFVA